MKVTPNKKLNYFLRKWLLKPKYTLRWLKYQFGFNKELNIYLITLPHSGNHWVQMMIAKSFIDYYDLDFEIKGVGGGNIAPVLKSEFRGNIKKDLPQIQKYHFFYFFMFRNKKIILLVRDLRDTLVSQYEKYKKKKDLNMLFSEFLRVEPYNDKDIHSLKGRIEFLNSWWKNKEELRKFKVVRYEDLKENPQRELEEILGFIGILDVDQKFLNNVVDFCSLENMKKIEKQKKGKNYLVNKGKTKRWQDYFSEGDLIYFKQIVQEKLVHDFGYDYLD